MSFKPTDEQVAARDLFLTGDSLAIEAGAGCLAADTLLNLNRGGKGFAATVEHVARQVAGTPTMERPLNGKRIVQGARRWDRSILTMIARAEGEVVRLAAMASAWCSGVQETLALTTDSGRSIRATADHPFLTREGSWARLGDLSIGDGIQVNVGRSRRGKDAKQQYRSVVTRFHPHQVRDSNVREKFKVPLHRATAEAEVNDLSLSEFLHIVRTDPAASATLTFLPLERHVHHRDGDSLNNALSNLVVLDDTEHHRLHAANGAANYVLWQVGVEFVTSIEPHGPEMTYDVEVADDPHNFLANGFVVHNTGKTTTLEFLAAEIAGRGQYVAFNKGIVTDAEKRMPNHVRCSTAHSLAFRAVGHRYKHRLSNSKRMHSWEIAERLGIDPFIIHVDGERKRLSQSYLAGLAMRSITRFCQSVDLEPSRVHVPYIDGIDSYDDGKRTYGNNRVVAAAIEDTLGRIWDDLLDPQGVLPYKHDHYLKLWHLSNPKIAGDCILFDEAQDANPVLMDIIASQRDAQLVWVGDSQQAIYGFTGAVNALANVPADRRAFLTHSFRFGPPIADVANGVLDRLGAELRLVGSDAVSSSLGYADAPSVVLARTNAVAVKTVLRAQQRGIRPHLVGGGTDVVRFAQAAEKLMSGGQTEHPELACFDSWAAVRDYVNHDEQGQELKLLVSLVETFGTDTIIRALDRMPPEKAASLVVSTAHKAKGREWSSVQLADDFKSRSQEELRLLYVAVTRAQHQLDVGEVVFEEADEDEDEKVEQRVEIRDGREYRVTVLPGDGRLEQ